MASAGLELRPTIDRRWLEDAGAADPITHAYSLWDLDRFPEQVRFVSALRGGEMQGYLLVWQPPRGPPVVHWVAPPLPELVSALPLRPLIVVGPEEVRPLVHHARGPCVDRSLLVQAAALGTRPAVTPLDRQVRRLTREDVRALEGFVRASEDPMVEGYAGLDPGSEVIVGGFEGDRLVGLARASIRRPSIWVVSGVYVQPAQRNQGWGRAVTRAVMHEAELAGAPCALFVREDRVEARAVYDRLGFHEVARRAWLDCGTGRVP
jgi:GNAT superfamily N-acetyltransferase